jgi:hypothetical protein
MLNVLDEFTHESLAIRVARKLKAIAVLSGLFNLRASMKPANAAAHTPKDTWDR